MSIYDWDVVYWKPKESFGASIQFPSPAAVVRITTIRISGGEKRMPSNTRSPSGLRRDRLPYICSAPVPSCAGWFTQPQPASGGRRLEPAVGIEPTTHGLQNRCSTAELSWPGKRAGPDRTSSAARPSTGSSQSGLFPQVPLLYRAGPVAAPATAASGY